MNRKLGTIILIVGIALVVEGFSAHLYTYSKFLEPTEPPTMKPIEGMDRVMLQLRQAFLISGIAGVFVTGFGVWLVLKNKKKE